MHKIQVRTEYGILRTAMSQPSLIPVIAGFEKQHFEHSFLFFSLQISLQKWTPPQPYVGCDNVIFRDCSVSQDSTVAFSPLTFRHEFDHLRVNCTKDRQMRRLDLGTPLE